MQNGLASRGKHTVNTTRTLLLCLLTEEVLSLSRGGAERQSSMATRCSTSTRNFVFEEFDQGKALSKTLNIEQLVLSLAGWSCIESLHRVS
jgi:hypothetical protein